MSETRSHHLVHSFNHPAADVFQALITPSQIRKWWSASHAIVIPRVGGIWCASWGDEDQPDFISFAIIKKFDVDERLVLHQYKYVSSDGGLPFDADFETRFELHPAGDGVDMTVDQTGFPADSIADEYYQSCEQGWKDTLESLSKFLNLNA
jgi:uncharacterized protein YndB with AHSA1/START domain